MNQVSRYIFVELLKTFAFALGGITLLTVLMFLAQEGLKQGLTLGSILRLIPFVLPNALYVSIPGTMLFCVCLVYGRMSANNEIIAVKSLGSSALRTIRPAILLATLLSLVTVWLNDIGVSWGRDGIYHVVLHSVEKTIYATLQTNKSFSNDQLSINVAAIRDHKMVYPTVIIPGSTAAKTKTISAESAEINCYPERGVLAVQMTNGTLTLGEGTSFHFDEISPELSLSDMTRKKGNLRSPSNYSLGELPDIIDHQSAGIEKQRRTMAMNAGRQMLAGDFSMLAPQNWRQPYGKVRNIQSRRRRMATEQWRRWANGFSCLLFAIIGAPLAIRLKNSDVWTSFGLCFIPVLLIYFPLMLIGIDRAKTGAMPAYAVWFGNGILLAIAIFMLRREWKH